MLFSYILIRLWSDWTIQDRCRLRRDYRGRSRSYAHVRRTRFPVYQKVEWCFYACCLSCIVQESQAVRQSRWALLQRTSLLGFMHMVPLWQPLYHDNRLTKVFGSTVTFLSRKWLYFFFGCPKRHFINYRLQIAGLVNIASNYLIAGQEASRHGTAHPSIVPYEVFPCKNGYLMIGAGNNKQVRITLQVD